MSQRRLTAILAADVVGYSRLMGEDETGTLEALKAHRKDLFDPEIARRGGRTVKLMGDGVLVEFPSVVDAVEAAMTVQRALAEGDGPIQLRMGINLGDVIVDGDEIYGDGVNVAARLEAEADPGAICISSLVHESIRNRVSDGFSDLGMVTLKNIDQPLHLFQWSPDGAPVSARTHSSASGTAGRSSPDKGQQTGTIVLIASAAALLIAGVVAGAGLQWFQDAPSSPAEKTTAATPPSATETSEPDTAKSDGGDPDAREAETASTAPETAPTETPEPSAGTAPENAAEADPATPASESAKPDETQAPTQPTSAEVKEPAQPADPVAVPGSEIAALLNGKTLRGGNEFGGDRFVLRLAEGGTFRGEIKFNDAFGSGGVDSGRWAVQEDNVCVNFLTFASGRKICAAVMRAGEVVTFKTPSGRELKWTLAAE